MFRIRNAYDVIAMGGDDTSLVTFLSTYTTLKVAVFGKENPDASHQMTRARGAAFGFEVYPELEVRNHIADEDGCMVTLTDNRCVKAPILIGSEGKVIAGNLEDILTHAETRLLHKMSNLRLVRFAKNYKIPA
ncbi:MAG: hypothetical protein QNK37_31445 [Acidobacteriota bacterium]|nr:hypothetical protein [Acidobacteriota bacterium]